MIQVQCAVMPPPVATALIERAAGMALPPQFEQVDLTIVLTDNAQLHQLNREYLGVDAATDVLSFPSNEKDPQTGVRYLGDILISIPQAGIQAQAAHHPLESEVQLLVVHGILHLLGYDHSEPAEKSRMWKVQGDILQSLGLGDIQVREE